MQTLADRLKEERGMRGWSQPELARRSGVKQSFIGALEAGNQKSSSWLPELAHALGVDAYWLKTGRGCRTTAPFRADTLLPPEVLALIDSIADASRTGSLTPEHAVGFSALVRATGVDPGLPMPDGAGSPTRPTRLPAITKRGKVIAAIVEKLHSMDDTGLAIVLDKARDVACEYSMPVQKTAS